MSRTEGRQSREPGKTHRGNNNILTYLLLNYYHLCVQVLDWFGARALRAYSISCGQSLLYNNIFPKHKERLDKKMSDLVVSVAKQEVPAWRRHFDVVVACEDDEGEDLDVPLVSIQFR